MKKDYTNIVDFIIRAPKDEKTLNYKSKNVSKFEYYVKMWYNYSIAKICKIKKGENKMITRKQQRTRQIILRTGLLVLILIGLTWIANGVLASIDAKTATTEQPRKKAIHSTTEIFQMNEIVSLVGEKMATTAKEAVEKITAKTIEAQTLEAETAAEVAYYEESYYGEPSYEESYYEAPSYQAYNGEVLNSWLGMIQGPSGTETYYNLPMGGVIGNMRANGFSEEQYPYWVRDDGVKMLGDYVMVAADNSIRPIGTLVESSLGTGIVCDTGEFIYTNPYQLDIATDW